MTRNTSSLKPRHLVVLAITTVLLGVSIAQADPAKDYAENCAECHGPDRLGALGPALIPQTLKRMRGPKVVDVILNGRV